MKSFKIPKDHSEAVTRGTDNTMDTCNITKGQTMIYKNKFQKAKQFVLHVRHPSCLSSYGPGCKS